MNILIVEDEPNSANFLENTLNSHYRCDHCIKHVSSEEDAVNMILKENIAVVLFKLNLNEGNSFDILEKVKSKNFESIFITDNPKEHEVIQAVKFAAHDFLHNPINTNDLINSIDSAFEKINNQTEVEKIDLILSLEEKTENATKSIPFQLLNGMRENINIADILFLEADSSVTYLHLKNNQKKSLPKNIGCYKDLLVKEFHFKSISKSIIINLMHLKSYNHNSLEICLKSGTTLYASRRGGKEFREYLHNFQPNDLADVLKGNS